MNKKEVAEIKKNFTDSSGFFTLNHIVSAYVDPHKNVRCKDNKLYALIPEDEGAVICCGDLSRMYGRLRFNV